MKLRANKQNLGIYSKQLLGNNYSIEREKQLFDVCLNDNYHNYHKIGYHISFAVADYLQKINDILGSFGVESLYNDGIDLDYCNMGETYALTIYFFNNRLYIGDWGSIAEKYLINND